MTTNRIKAGLFFVAAALAATISGRTAPRFRGGTAPVMPVWRRNRPRAAERNRARPPQPFRSYCKRYSHAWTDYFNSRRGWNSTPTQRKRAARAGGWAGRA